MIDVLLRFQEYALLRSDESDELRGCDGGAEYGFEDGFEDDGSMEE